MSEYVEDSKDDDYEAPFYKIEDSDLRAEVAELREQVQAEAADRRQVSAINRVIEDFRFQHGLRLSASDVQSLGELIDAGHSVGDAYRELEAGDFDSQFLAAVEKIETREGRSLLESEVQKLWEASVRESDPEHVDQDAILDPDKDSDRAALIDGMLAGDQLEPEPVAPLAEDATDAERQAYIAARESGAEVEAPEETE